MAFALPWGAELGIDDLRDLPEDGHRYELLDGTLLVTPSPGIAHQSCVSVLLTTLADACGPEHLAFTAPLDVILGPGTVLQPDVLVVRRADIAGQRLQGVPVLVVEVQSPSTRLIDLNLKRHAYADAGVPWYWLVDPAGPSVTVLALADASYRQEASAGGGDALRVSEPFPVTVVPQDLLQGLDI
ncbi:MAG: Uma2 family endonuclease [Acidimicrobiales bacterium]